MIGYEGGRIERFKCSQFKKEDYKTKTYPATRFLLYKGTTSAITSRCRDMNDKKGEFERLSGIIVENQH